MTAHGGSTSTLAAHSALWDCPSLRRREGAQGSALPASSTSPLPTAAGQAGGSSGMGMGQGMGMGPGTALPSCRGLSSATLLRVVRALVCGVGGHPPSLQASSTPGSISLPRTHALNPHPPKSPMEIKGRC